jgi:hypothetical protein
VKPGLEELELPVDLMDLMGLKFLKWMKDALEICLIQLWMGNCASLHQNSPSLEPVVVTGGCEEWCTNDVTVGDGCGDNSEMMCAAPEVVLVEDARCPVDFPFTADGVMCYSTAEYASAGVGPCESWCTHDATEGVGCGDAGLKMCTSPLCPADFPYITTDGTKCYNVMADAVAGHNFSCEGWCITDEAVDIRL